MKRKTRGLFSFLLALAMMVGRMPVMRQASYAEGSRKAIRLVENGAATNIEGERKSNIYFGNYLQSSDGAGGFRNEPIKWRVLENANGELFLIADQALDCAPYHAKYEPVTWKVSTIRSWLNGYGASKNIGGDSGIDYSGNNFIDAAFNAKEQPAIARANVINKDNPVDKTKGGSDTTDKIFLLSLDETLQYFGLKRNSGGFIMYAAGDEVCCWPTEYALLRGVRAYSWDEDHSFARDEVYGEKYRKYDGACYWWLRSPGYVDRCAANVHDFGFVSTTGGSVDVDDVAVRPAFKLHLNSVLFTSAAAGGKSAEVGTISAVGDYSESDWKITLLDDERNEFDASFDSKSDDVIAVEYSGAKTGANEYISALIKDSSGVVTYYGKIANASSESGSVDIDVSGKLNDGDTLYVFNEQDNGDYRTDYASNLQAFAFPSTEDGSVDIDEDDRAGDDDTLDALNEQDNVDYKPDSASNLQESAIAPTPPNMIVRVFIALVLVALMLSGLVVGMIWDGKQKERR